MRSVGLLLLTLAAFAQAPQEPATAKLVEPRGSAVKARSLKELMVRPSCSRYRRP